MMAIYVLTARFNFPWRACLKILLGQRLHVRAVFKEVNGTVVLNAPPMAVVEGSGGKLPRSYFDINLD